MLFVFMKWECMGVSICMLCNIGIVLDFSARELWIFVYGIIGNIYSLTVYVCIVTILMD